MKTLKDYKIILIFFLFIISCGKSPEKIRETNTIITSYRTNIINGEYGTRVLTLSGGDFLFQNTFIEKIPLGVPVKMTWKETFAEFLDCYQGDIVLIKVEKINE